MRAEELDALSVQWRAQGHVWKDTAARLREAGLELASNDAMKVASGLFTARRAAERLAQTLRGQTIERPPTLGPRTD